MFGEPMRLIYPIFLFFILLASCTSQDQIHHHPDQVLATYKTWQRANSDPLPMPSELWYLCRLPMFSEVARQESPHSDRFSNVYVNEIGAEASGIFGERTFPVGTVLVKEKLLEVDDAVAAGIGMMFKREAGFDSAAGDWEYMYWENGELGQDTTQLAHCQACHYKGELSAETIVQFEQVANFYSLSREAQDSVFTVLVNQ